MITGVDYIVNLPSLSKEVLHYLHHAEFTAPKCPSWLFLQMLALNRKFPTTCSEPGTTCLGFTTGHRFCFTRKRSGF